MKKFITIVCFCLSVPFLAQETNKKQQEDTNDKVKKQQTTDTKVTDSKEDVKNDNQKAKAGTSGNIPSISKDDIKARVSNNNASQQSGTSKEKKRKEATKDGEKKAVEKTVKSSEVKPPEVVKKTENKAVSSSGNHQKPSGIPEKSGVIDDLKKQRDRLSEEKRKQEEKVKKISGELEKTSRANDAEKAKAKKRLLISLFFAFLLFVALLYYFIKNKRLKSKMNHQKLSLKEVVKKQELLFTQLVEFSKEKLNIDDLEKKILFVNPTSEKSVLKSEKDHYLEFIARIQNNITILSKGIHAAGKELKEKEEMIIRLKDEIQSPNLPENYLKLGQEKQELEKENTFLKRQFSDLEKDKTAIIPHYSVPSDTYISSNILVSAGPRKEKDNDTELGEDSSGIYNTPYGTYFWILDGTSDSGRIEFQKSHVFSSRVLSQQLGNAIFTVVSDAEYEKSGNEDTLKSILDKAITKAKITIVSIVKNAPYEIHQQIIDHINNNQNPYCSTTILLGFLDKNGNLWHLYLGDSQLYSFSITDERFIQNERAPNEGKGRLFLSMNLSKEKNIVFETNNYEENILSFVKKGGVDYVMAFSDGIGSSEKALSIQPKQVLSKISFTEQKSYDDKSLIVLERKKFL